MHFLYLHIFHLQLVVLNVHPKEVNVRLFELTLVDVEVEIVLFEDGKYFVDYFLMVF